MSDEVRPHGGKVVFLLGVLGLLTALCMLPLGAIAWILGSKELAGMREGRIDRSGQRQVSLGRNLGIAGVILWATSLGFAVYQLVTESR